MKANHLKTLLPMLTAALILGGCGNTNTTQTDILETNNAEQIETEHVTESTEISLDEQTETEITTEETEGMNGNGAGDVYIPTEEEDLAIEDEATLAQQEAQEADEQLESESEENVVDYTVEEMSATMYATQTVNVRDLPTTEGNKVGSKSYAEKVEVTGKVTSYKGEKCLWYQLSDGTFVSGNYLSESKPAQQASNSNSNSNTGSTSNNSESSSNSSSSNNGGSNSSGSSNGISQSQWDALFADDGGDSTAGGDASADSGYNGNGWIN